MKKDHIQYFGGIIIPPPERGYEKVAVEESRVMKAKGCGVGRIVRGLQENPSP